MIPSAALARLSLDAMLRAALTEALSLLEVPEALAMALDVGELPLPDFGGGPNQALLRALGPLYLASEIESAGLLQAVEGIGALWASGGLPLEADGISEKLAMFWRKRNERFAESERQALFARVFGGGSGPVLAGSTPANRDFVLCMVDLTDTLSRTGDEYAGLGASPRLDVELGLRARLLLENLSRHGSGFALYAAGDILSAVRVAVDILNGLAARHLWGSRDLWTLVRALHERLRRTPPQIEAHVRRGQAGMVVLGWLADVSSKLTSPAPSLPTPSNVALAAAAWIQTSVIIEGAGRRSLARVA
jgi:hypothetical protein